MFVNQEQFSDIYDKNIEKIYRFVYLKVSSQEIAQDITSKVFLKGWDAFRLAKEDIVNPTAFLYGIARNTIADHYREKDKTNIVSNDAIANIPEYRYDIHEKTLANDDLARVKNALGNLKKEYQDVIIWHYLEDMSAEQISNIIKKPAGTVRVMIHRGLKTLREEIKEI